MAGKPVLIYIRAEDLQRWALLGNNERPAFISWALANYPPIQAKLKQKQGKEK